MISKQNNVTSVRTSTVTVIVVIELILVTFSALLTVPGVVSATGWNPTVLITDDNANNTAPSGNPMTATDIFRNVHVVWGDLSDLDNSGPDVDIFYRKWNSTMGLWESRVLLSKDDSNKSVGPKVAGDSYGNIHVVWNDDNISASFPYKWTIQNRMWNALTGSWEVLAFPINETTTSFSDPRIAGDPYGNIHLVATDSVRIHHMVWNGTTKAWGEPSVVVEGNPHGQRLSVDGDGNVHVVWRDDTDILGSGTDPDIFYLRLDRSTGLWNPVQLISDDNLNNTKGSWFPAVAADPLGNVHVVWEDFSELDGSGPDSDIFYRRFNVTSGTWEPRVLVTNDNLNNTEASQMSDVATDPLGNTHIVWDDRSDLEQTGSNDRDIHYRKWNASTGLWEGRHLVTDLMTDVFMSRHPHIAVDLLGNANTVWEDGDLLGNGDDLDIFYRRWESGITLPEYFPVRVSPLTTKIVSPGSSNIISAMVYNGGNVSDSASVIAFYNSTTPAFPFIQANVPPLKTAEKSPAYQANWEAPLSLGTYEVTIEVDYLDDVAEIFENNNKATIEFVVIGVVDYIPFDMVPSTPQYVQPDSLTTISASVKNEGTASSGNLSTIAFYNSTTPLLPFFKDSAVPDLLPGENSPTYQAEWRAPSFPGSYEVAIEVDYGKDVVEIDETNNVFLIEFNDVSILPPANLTLSVLTGDDIFLNWTAPSSPLLDHYLIYRSTDQRDFDFANPVHNTSSDLDPLKTDWMDMGAANSTSPGEYYYVVRAVNSLGSRSATSNTAGKWTRSFREGRDAFSLPLEPFITRNVSWYSENIPGTDFIRWMNATGHWVTHYPSMGEGVNDIPAIMGDSYEISLSSPTSFTFCGYPASMIRFREGLGDSLAFRRSLSAKVDGNDINLSWEAVAGADSYIVFRSEERSDLHDLSLLPIANATETYWIDSGVIGGGRSEYYHMVIPVDSSGGLGSSTYSVGVFSVEYRSGSDTFALPLKPVEPHSLDWYCDNIPNVVGIIHLMKGYWRLHAIEMPEGVYDADALQGEGYQISVDGNSTRFTFVGY
ncbi:MAG: hypothetical protein KAR39_10505 [Thermoplasmata archaeon]|nr:hypothetical protein [Thermoplasmata archaeon]